MNPQFCVIIPARLASTRLPDKVLLDIVGKPLLQHVYEAAVASDADRVVIATDSVQVQDAAGAFSAECIMTSAEHASGTDRLAEAVGILDLPAESIVVNVQGDEYGLPPELVNQLAGLLRDNPASPMATLCERISRTEDRDNPDVVKVVADRSGTALYFSRAAIPWQKQGEAQSTFRHIGMYAYRVDFLKEFARLPVCELERQESLEQLRALYYGYSILVDEACADAGIGIDTESDLALARDLAGR